MLRSSATSFPAPGGAAMAAGGGERAAPTGHATPHRRARHCHAAAGPLALVAPPDPPRRHPPPDAPDARAHAPTPLPSSLWLVSDESVCQQTKNIFGHY